MICCRLKLGISQFVIEGIKPFAFKQMVDSLTSFTAEKEGFLT